MLILEQWVLSGVINLLKVKFMQSLCWVGPEILAAMWEVQHQESDRHMPSLNGLWDPGLWLHRFFLILHQLVMFLWSIGGFQTPVAEVADS